MVENTNPINVQSPIGASVDQAAAQAVPPEVKKRIPDFMKKKPFIVSLVVVIIILISLGVISLNKKVGPVSKQGDILLATVGDMQIYKSQVQKEAEQQFGANGVNDKILKSQLNRVIEEAILAKEAGRLNIKVEATESAARAKFYIGTSSAQVSQAIMTRARVDVLRMKIMRQFVSSRLVFTVNFWTPGSNYPQSELTDAEKKLAIERQAEGKIALPQIATLMKRNIEPLEATRTIMKNSQFATIKPVMAVNGYIVDKTKIDEPMIKPRLYTSSDKAALGSFIYDAIFNTKAGDIKSVITADGSIGFVIKVIEAKDAQYKTYAQWLNAKRKELVKIITPL